jgi:hypothetical protein
MKNLTVNHPSLILRLQEKDDMSNKRLTPYFCRVSQSYPFGPLILTEQPFVYRQH